MGQKLIVVLGGYGNTGGRIAGLLLAHSDADLRLAGRSEPRARALAAALNERVGAERVTAAAVDAGDPGSLAAACAGASLVIAASSTGDLVRHTARAAVDARADYVDIQLSARSKHDALRALEPAMREAGLRFVTDCGYAPGLPAAVVRRAAREVDTLEEAWVGSCSRMDYRTAEVSSASGREAVLLMREMQAQALEQGRWRKASLLRRREFDFGEPYGRRACAPLFTEELRALPEQIPGLQRAGFYASGFGGVADVVAMPLSLLLVAVAPRRGAGAAGRVFAWGLRRASRPPFGVRIVLEGRGTKGSRPAVVRLCVGHGDGYDATAIATACCVLQLLDGTIARPGLSFAGAAVEPQRMFRDLERLGMAVSVSTEAA